MSARLERLEALLERVQRNAEQPRLAPSGATMVAASTDDDLLELDEPGASSPPPVEPIEDLDDLDDIEEVGGDDLDLDEEAPPESGVGRGAGAVERAMEADEHQPPMTPPPESGEEPAPRVHVPPQRGPTMEQLGQTISLDEGPEEDLQLDQQPSEEAAATPAPPSQLEAELPKGGGAYDDQLKSPPEAQRELDRVRLGETSSVQPEISQRPVLSTNVIDLVRAQREFEPESFFELLEASLRL